MWTIGILAYELNAGSAPFESNSRHETQRRIKSLEYTFPEHFSADLIDFLKRLLVSDPQKRMK
jgi:serine/threonine protein kinase